MTRFDRRSRSHRDPARPAHSRRRRFAPALDALEVRALLSTLVVTNAHDSGSGSLRQQIADASTGDTITFSNKLKGQTITLTSGELDVTSSITISGPGAGKLAVSGGGSSEVFNIDSGVTATISGLTITDGYAADGGGINNLGTLTLEHSAVTGNQANGAASPYGAFETQGGGIQNGIGATLTMEDCTISGNEAIGASDDSGAFGESAYGGGIANNGALTISGSTISGNQAIGGASTSVGGSAYGGGIYDTSYFVNGTFSPATLTIVDSTISGNQAIGASVTSGTIAVGGYAQGGGIDNVSGAATTINGSTISGNQAIGGSGGDFGDAAGGGMISEGSFVTITATAFTDNLAQGGAGVNGAFIPSGALATGGGLDSEGDALTITGSTFRGNQASGGAGGTSGGAARASAATPSAAPWFTARARRPSTASS